MLEVPEQHKSFRLVSVDPGSRLMGIAVFEVDHHSRTILNADSELWEVHKFEDPDNFSAHNHPAMIVRLYQIRKKLTEFFDTHKPLAVVFERPFFNSGTPGAFGPLLRVIEAVQIMALEHNPIMLIDYLEPMVVKKLVGASLTSDKSSVSAAMLDKEDLKHLPICSKIPELGKDAVDALAIGYSYIHYCKGELVLDEKRKKK